MHPGRPSPCNALCHSRDFAGFYLSQLLRADRIPGAGRHRPIRHTTPANPDLLFLAIDSDSVSLDETLDLQGLFSSSLSDPGSHRALEIICKGSPWNREIYALILDRLVRASAKVVAFDCLFSASAPGDDAFRVALSDSSLRRLLEAISFLLTASSDRPEFLPATSRLPKRSSQRHRRKMSASGSRIFLLMKTKLCAELNIGSFRERENSIATYSFHCRHALFQKPGTRN